MLLRACDALKAVSGPSLTLPVRGNAHGEGTLRCGALHRRPRLRMNTPNTGASKSHHASPAVLGDTTLQPLSTGWRRVAVVVGALVFVATGVALGAFVCVAVAVAIAVCVAVTDAPVVGVTLADSVFVGGGVTVVVSDASGVDDAVAVAVPLDLVVEVSVAVAVLVAGVLVAVAVSVGRCSAVAVAVTVAVGRMGVSVAVG
jgi:hypothetical protein